MIVCGIDVSTSCTGVVFYDNKKRLVVHQTMVKNPTKQPVGEYLARIRSHLCFILKQQKPDVVVLEELFISFNKAAKAMLPIHGVVREAVFCTVGQECIGYPQQTWRSVLGIAPYSKAEKEKMKKKYKKKAEFKRQSDIKNKVIAYVNARLGTDYTYAQNDMVDAVGLCLAWTDKDRMEDEAINGDD